MIMKFVFIDFLCLFMCSLNTILYYESIGYSGNKYLSDKMFITENSVDKKAFIQTSK